jgi:hypothetical protein
MYKYNPPYAIVGGVGPDPGNFTSLSRQLGPRFADYEFPHEREAREKAEKAAATTKPKARK